MSNPTTGTTHSSLNRIPGQPSSLELNTEWATEDIDHFVHSSKVCEACRIAIAAVYHGLHRDTSNNSSEEEIQRKLVESSCKHPHHDSVESLFRSVKSGCRICTFIDKKLSRLYGASLAPSKFVFEYRRSGNFATVCRFLSGCVLNGDIFPITRVFLGNVVKCEVLPVSEN